MNELIEFSSNRHNPGIDPHLHAWGWEIPVYLFLGGLVAGLLILGGYRILKKPGPGDDEAYPWAPMLGVLLLSAGMGALFLDLAHKFHVWRLYLTFQPTSPMSWGAWILVLVYPALLLAAVLHPPEKVPFGEPLLVPIRGLSAWLHARERLVLAIGLANIAGGLALGVYTGILLGSLGARPLWNSAILGPLFLFSGLSTAAALLHLLTLVHARREGETGYADLFVAGLFRLVDKDAGHGKTMVTFDQSFMTIELGILGLWMLGLATATPAHRAAADLLLTGHWAPAFWSFVVVAGLVVPLVLQTFELFGNAKQSRVTPLLVLFGGFALRWILVSAGQASHW